MPHDGLAADNADSTLQIVKEQQLFLRIAHAKLRLPAKPGVNDRVPRWWRMTGSNRRPPACKAGALPAELIPLGGDGGSGWIRTNDPRLIKTVL